MVCNVCMVVLCCLGLQAALDFPALRRADGVAANYFKGQFSRSKTSPFLTCLNASAWLFLILLTFQPVFCIPSVIRERFQDLEDYNVPTELLARLKVRSLKNYEKILRKTPHNQNIYELMYLKSIL